MRVSVIPHEEEERALEELRPHAGVVGEVGPRSDDRSPEPSRFELGRKPSNPSLQVRDLGFGSQLDLSGFPALISLDIKLKLGYYPNREGLSPSQTQSAGGFCSDRL